MKNLETKEMNYVKHPYPDELQHSSILRNQAENIFDHKDSETSRVYYVAPLSR